MHFRVKNILKNNYYHLNYQKFLTHMKKKKKNGKNTWILCIEVKRKCFLTHMKHPLWFFDFMANLTAMF
jgi:hypothetical protein